MIAVEFMAMHRKSHVFRLSNNITITSAVWLLGTLYINLNFDNVSCLWASVKQTKLYPQEKKFPCSFIPMLVHCLYFKRKLPLFRSVRAFFKNQFSCSIWFDFPKIVLICPPILFHILSNLKSGSHKTLEVCPNSAGFSSNNTLKYAKFSFFFIFCHFAIFCIFHFGLNFYFICTIQTQLQSNTVIIEYKHYTNGIQKKIGRLIWICIPNMCNNTVYANVRNYVYFILKLLLARAMFMKSTHVKKIIWPCTAISYIWLLIFCRFQ